MIGKWLLKLVNKLDIPAEAVDGVPEIKIVGMNVCCVDHHAGLLAYNENEIQIAMQHGGLKISGCDLILQKMHPDCVCVCGKIANISLYEDRG